MKDKRKQCYSCFEDDTFQYHGLTDNLAEEIKRFISKVFEGEVIECAKCGRTVRYTKNGGKWREESI